MLTPTNDIRLTDYLTTYLKHFKISFHLQLALIELIAAESPLISEHIQKIQTTKCDIYAQFFKNQGVGQIMVTKDTWKTIERFFMRINQFVEYRVAKLKNIADGAVREEINRFYQGFQNLVAQMSKDLQSAQFPLTTVFLKLSNVEDHYLDKITHKVIKSIKYSPLPPQNLNNIQQMFKNRNLKKLEFQQKEGIQDQTKESDDSETSKKNRNSYNIRSSFLVEKSFKTRGRRATIQSHQHFRQEFQKKKQYHNLSICEPRDNIRERSPTENSKKNNQSYSPYITQHSKTKSTYLMEDLLDLDIDDRRPQTKKNLLKQLQQLNKKNDIAIYQYLRGIKKKKEKKKKNISKILVSDPVLTMQLEESRRAQDLLSFKQNRARTHQIMDQKVKKNQVESLRREIMKLPSIKIKNK